MSVVIPSSMSRSLKTRQIDETIVKVIVQGTGTAAILGDDAKVVTITDNGTGDYTISMITGGAAQRDLIPLAIVPITARAICRVTSVSSSAINITVLRDDNTAMDADFYLSFVWPGNVNKF